MVLVKADAIANDSIMGWKPRFFAAINACQYAGFKVNNQGSMDKVSARIDQENIDNKVRNYLKALDGLKITIPISDIAGDLNLTEECVVKILNNWEMDIEDEG